MKSTVVRRTTPHEVPASEQLDMDFPIGWIDSGPELPSSPELWSLS